MNVHRVNWLWANPEVFQEGRRQAADHLGRVLRRRRGAEEGRRHSGRARRPELAGLHHLRERGAWRGGADFYKKALVQLDAARSRARPWRRCWNLQEGEGLHRQERPWPRLEPGHRDGHQGRGGHAADGRLGQGRVLAAGKVPGKDFVCVAAPGTAKAFTYNVDSFALFKLKNADNQKAQKDGRRHHVPRLPGGVQPQQGLHSRCA